MKLKPLLTNRLKMKLTGLRTPQRLLGTILVLILTIGISGCVALEVIPSVLSATGSYYSYKAAKVEPVNVTTISKDCHLYEYVEVDDETWEALPNDVKQHIGINNKLMVENCPNIDRQ